jgi:hypothetical protein
LLIQRINKAEPNFSNQGQGGEINAHRELICLFLENKQLRMGHVLLTMDIVFPSASLRTSYAKNLFNIIVSANGWSGKAGVYTE